MAIRITPKLPTSVKRAPSQSQVKVGGRYEIRQGDTLTNIAKQLQAQGMKGRISEIIDHIMMLNPGIKDEDLIITGNNLVLPSAAQASQSTFAAGSGTSASAAGIGAGTDVFTKLNRGFLSALVPIVVTGSHQPVPFISQYRPDGAEHGYSNAAANCGPTSVAMLARGFGAGKGMTDAQLIHTLGQMGGTSAAGTGLNGIVKMARFVGARAEPMTGGANLAWIDSKLRCGQTVVANGDYFAMPPHQNEQRTSGHFIAVIGKDVHGNYILRDPADRAAQVATPEQLAHFINSNTNTGGYQVAIQPPALNNAA